MRPKPAHSMTAAGFVSRVLVAVAVSAAGLCAQTFADVSSSSLYYNAAELFWQRGITAGCGMDGATGKPMFCPDAIVTRGQVSAFVIRGIFSALNGDGENFTLLCETNPDPTDPCPHFADVATAHVFYRYIEKMWELGITAGTCDHDPVGCPGYRLYSPDASVTNGQIAVFATRAQMSRNIGGLGVRGLQPSCYGTAGDCANLNDFDDVPIGDVFHDWVEAIYTQIGSDSKVTCTGYRRFCRDFGAPRGQIALDLYDMALNRGQGIHTDVHPQYSISSPVNTSTLQYLGADNSVTFTITSPTSTWPLTLDLAYSCLGCTDIAELTVCPQANCGTSSTVTVSGLSWNDAAHPYVYALLRRPTGLGGINKGYRYSTPSPSSLSAGIKEYIRLGGRVIAIEDRQVSSNPPQTVAAPTFNPPAGTYTSTQSVTLLTSTAGAPIRYTTDGSQPSSTVGTLYSAPIPVSTTTTIKAIAYKDGWVSSQVVSAMYTLSLPPTVVSLSPTSGTGTNQQFTATYQDPNGWADIQDTYFLVNSSQSFPASCTVWYSRSLGYFQFLNEDATAWSVVYPGYGSAQNSRCTLYGAGSSVTPNVNNLSVTLNLSFSQTNFAGSKYIYLFASTPAGLNTGWVQEGPWTIPQASSVSISISPTYVNLYAGNSTGFTARVTGATEQRVTWEVSSSQRPTDPGSLVDLGCYSGLGDYYCSAGYSAPSSVASPFWVSITARSRADTSKTASAWVYVQPPPGPTLVSISPLYGSGTRATFTFAVSDPTASLYWIQPFFSATYPLNTGAAGCHLIFYPQSNTLYLDGDSGDSYWIDSTWIGGNDIQNSYCIAHGASSSYVQSGGTYYLALDIEFLPAAYGTYKYAYMSAEDLNYFMADWQYFGWWYIPW